MSLLGVNFGSNLLPAQEGVNEKGFWEHQEIVYLHEALLSALGFAWDDVRPLPDGWWRTQIVETHRHNIVRAIERDFSDIPLWGIKDPRICRLIPLWLEVFEELRISPVFVFISRHPIEVAASLGKRDGFSVEKSALLYLHHMLSAEKWTRGYPRCFIDYTQLLADPISTVRAVSEKLEVVWPGEVEEVNGKILEFLSSRFRHHVADASAQVAPEYWAGPLVDAVYRDLCALGGTETEGASDRLDRVEDEFVAVLSRLDPAFVSHIATLQGRVDQVRQQLEAVNANANAQITYRDKLVEEVQSQLEAVNANANAQIAYRDQLVADVIEQINQAEAMLRSRKLVFRQFLKLCLGRNR